MTGGAEAAPRGRQLPSRAMNTAPRVTVLMTLYNKGPYVLEAVRSVLNQTFTDFELLVVDDASTDGGLEVVKGIDDPRIRILESAANTGMAATANRGYDAAQSEYVAVLDADDLMHAERLALQVAFMDAHPETGISGTAYEVLDNPATIGRWPATDTACRSKLIFGDPVLYGSCIIRRSVLQAHGLRCNTAWLYPGMDYLFTLSFHRHTRYANLPDVLTYYRMGANNMRHQRDAYTDKKRIVQEVFRLLELPISNRELELQMALHGLFLQPFTAEQVHALKTWTSHLVSMNKERNLFPADEFQAEVERRWKHLFHTFADQGAGAAMAHMRLSGGYPWHRLSYMAKVTLNRWAGRNQ